MQHILSIFKLCTNTIFIGQIFLLSSHIAESNLTHNCRFTWFDISGQCLLTFCIALLSKGHFFFRKISVKV